MKLSEKIANCPKCKEYSRIIDPINSDDLFQDAWIDIHKYETKNPTKASEVKHYKTYFFRALTFRYWNRTKATKRHLNIIDVKESDIVTSLNSSIPSEAFLNEWLEEKTTDEIRLFYKNIITLVVKCKNTEDASRMCNMSRSKFHLHLKEAKQQLKNDINRFTVIDNGLGDFVV